MPVNGNPDLLNSWKEIARYVQRGVRTVQRWEEENGLPVRRMGSRGKSAVFAFKREIDDWLERLATKKSRQGNSEPDWADVEKARQLRAEMHQLIARQRELAESLRRTREELVQVRKRIKDGTALRSARRVSLQ